MPDAVHRTGPETERLQHRAFEVSDAAAFFALNSNPEVMRYTGEPLIPSLQAAKDAIAGYSDFEVVGYGRWACVLKATGAVIGFCGLKYLPDLDAVDIGYRFFPDYWGHGIATEACTACLEFGFAELKLKEIIGLAMPENLGSIRVMEKCGMRFHRNFVYDGIPVVQYVKQAPECEEFSQETETSDRSRT